MQTARGGCGRAAGVDLTPTEWGILLALATVPGRVYSRYELINRVRGYEFEGYERTVDSPASSTGSGVASRGCRRPAAALAWPSPPS
jgi:Transcriptional regulatory protein, C terminal